MAQMPAHAEEDPPAIQQRQDRLHACIKEQYRHLCASAAAMIVNRQHGIRERQLIDLSEEIVQEAISRALAKAAEYDPTRRPVPWLLLGENSLSD